MKIIPEEEKTPDERLVHDFYFNTLKWCGCGNPDTALMYMRDVLAAMHKRSENNHASTNTWAADSEELYKLLNLNACEPLALSYLYMLDALGLTETQVIHLALAELAARHLPGYEPDDGPVAKATLARIRKRVPQGRMTVDESLF